MMEEWKNGRMEGWKNGIFQHSTIPPFHHSNIPTFHYSNIPTISIMGKITIEDMQFFAYHGCFEEEQITGTRFSVNISINTDTTSAESTDDLSQTIDYQAVYNLVKEEMAISSKLLEHVARRILNRLFREFPAAQSANIKVSKINPSLGGKLGLVSVTLSGENIELR